MPTSRRNRAKLPAMLCAALGVYACPAAAATTAPTGGVGAPMPIAPSSGQSGYGKPGTRAIVVAPTALLGHTIFVRGTLPGAARRSVILQRLDPARGWRDERGGRVRSNGHFLIGWRASVSGRLSLRVAIASRHHRARRDAAAPVAKVNVYRPANATFFGPGLYGDKTACGEILTPLLLGVAHRQLKCGTLVAILYAGREIVVPVVDRGPFHAGYSWDLTQATADALGFASAGAIGYMRAVPAS